MRGEKKIEKESIGIKRGEKIAMKMKAKWEMSERMKSRSGRNKQK